jgi:acyl carrier protein
MADAESVWIMPLSSLASPASGTSDPATQSAFEAEIAHMIVDVLHLEMTPAEIAPDAPLFRDGLGLDSIDALELALHIAQRYGINLRSDDERNGEIFASLRELARFIASHRAS